MSFMDGINRYFLKAQFSDRDVFKIYRKIIKYVNAKKGVTESMYMIEMQESNNGKNPGKPTVAALRAWRERMIGGDEFYQAIEGWVPDNERNMIRAGESSGNLLGSLERAMHMRAANKEMKSRIRKTMFSPVVNLLALTGVLILVGYQLVPAFEETDILPTDQWTGLSFLLLKIARFVQEDLALTGIIFVSSIVAFFLSLSRFTGPIRSILDRYPPYSIYRISYGTNFLLSFASLLKANVNSKAALEQIRDGSDNKWYRERLNLVIDGFSKGKGMGDAFYDAGTGFPDDEIIIEIKAFANLNDFATVLEDLANQSISESLEKVDMLGKSIAGIIQAITYVGLGIVTFGIADLMNKMGNVQP